MQTKTNEFDIVERTVYLMFKHYITESMFESFKEHNRGTYTFLAKEYSWDMYDLIARINRAKGLMNEKQYDAAVLWCKDILKNLIRYPEKISNDVILTIVSNNEDVEVPPNEKQMLLPFEYLPAEIQIIRSLHAQEVIRSRESGLRRSTGPHPAIERTGT